MGWIRGDIKPENFGFYKPPISGQPLPPLKLRGVIREGGGIPVGWLYVCVCVCVFFFKGFLARVGVKVLEAKDDIEKNNLSQNGAYFLGEGPFFCG